MTDDDDNIIDLRKFRAERQSAEKPVEYTAAQLRKMTHLAIDGKVLAGMWLTSHMNRVEGRTWDWEGEPLGKRLASREWQERLETDAEFARLHAVYQERAEIEEIIARAWMEAPRTSDDYA